MTDEKITTNKSEIVDEIERLNETLYSLLTCFQARLLKILHTIYKCQLSQVMKGNPWRGN